MKDFALLFIPPRLLVGFGCFEDVFEEDGCAFNVDGLFAEDILPEVLSLCDGAVVDLRISIWQAKKTS